MAAIGVHVSSYRRQQVINYYKSPELELDSMTDHPFGENTVVEVFLNQK